jgi:superfamily I DNA/RNA helicase
MWSRTHTEGSGVAWDQGLDKAGVAYKIAAAGGDRIRVIAGPGTGKSYAMKRRVARLLEEQVSPEKVLAVTFTRVAAEDLLPNVQKEGTPKVEIDAKLEEARRLFFVGITRVKASSEHVGSLFITYPREIGANKAKGLSMPYTKVNNGQAQLTPSIFIQELGPAAPAPIVGKV